MKRFVMNDYLWKVITVPANSRYLLSRTGPTVGTTDPNTLCVYISEELTGEFKTRVILHELSHCMMFSYGYIEIIHQYCKRRHWIDMEELIANLIADRAKEIYERAYEIVGDKAIRYVPYGLERYVM